MKNRFKKIVTLFAILLTIGQPLINTGSTMFANENDQVSVIVSEVEEKQEVVNENNNTETMENNGTPVTDFTDPISLSENANANDSPETGEVTTVDIELYEEPIQTASGMYEIGTTTDGQVILSSAITMNNPMSRAVGNVQGQVISWTFGGVTYEGVKITIDGKGALCIDRDLRAPWEADTPYDSGAPYLNTGLQSILYYGAYGPTNPNPSDLDIIRTEIAASNWLRGSTEPSQSVANSDPYIASLIQKAKNNDVPSTTISLSKKNVTSVVSGNKQVSEKIKLNGSNNSITFSVPADVTFVNETTGISKSGATVTVNAGETFYFTASLAHNNDYSSGQLTPANGAWTALVFTPFSAGYQRLVKGQWVDPLVTDGFTVNFFARKGSVTITKQDSETGSVAQGAATLDGAEYKLVDAAGTVFTATIQNGTATFRDVLIGNYTVVETKAPTGYQLNSTVYSGTLGVDGNGEIKSTTIVKEDVIKGGFEVIKIGEKFLNGVLPEFNGQKPLLEGAEFTVTSNTTNKVVAVFTTDANGHFSTGATLPFDTYTVSETKTPPGYLTIDDFTVTITEHGQMFNYVIEDSVIQSFIKIVKTEAGFQTPVAGAKFKIRSVETGEFIKQQVYYPIMEVIDTFETTVDGTVMLPQQLTAGDYELIEVEPAFGFLPNETPIPFTVDADSEEIIEINVENTRIPATIGTLFAEIETGSKITYAIDEVTLTDHISYEYLVPGEQATATLTLMDAETEEPLMYEGKEVTAVKVFTPETSHGEVEVSITFDASALKGKKIVAYEEIVQRDVEVASHKDIKDADQSFDFANPEIGTQAAGIDGNKDITAAEKVVLEDTVYYEGAVPGKEVVVSGKLMDKGTNAPLLIDGKEIVSEFKFTPDSESGKVKVTFEFNAKDLAGKDIVVFEEMTYKNKVIAEHKDINDVGQTVHIKAAPEPIVPFLPLTGEDLYQGATVGFAMMLAVMVIFFKNKKANKETK